LYIIETIIELSKNTAKMKWYKKKQSDKNMYTNNPKWSHKEM